MLRRLAMQLPLQQFAQTQASIVPQSQTAAAMQQSATVLHIASYSTKANPKERKRQAKSDKKKGKQDQQTAAGAADNTSFTEEGNAVEPDVTKLVLQVCSNKPFLTAYADAACQQHCQFSVADQRTVRFARRCSIVQKQQQMCHRPVTSLMEALIASSMGFCCRCRMLQHCSLLDNVRQLQSINLYQRHSVTSCAVWYYVL